MKMTTTVVLARLVADHMMAVAFNLEFDKLADRRTRIQLKLENEAELAYQKVSPAYETRVMTVKDEVGMPPKVRDMDPIRVIRTFKNKDEYERLAKLYGKGHPMLKRDATTVSLVYFRVDGLLMALHGSGKPVLLANQRCTDEEWASIKAGDVPPKFLNPAY